MTTEPKLYDTPLTRESEDSLWQEIFDVIGEENPEAWVISNNKGGTNAYLHYLVRRSDDMYVSFATFGGKLIPPDLKADKIYRLLHPTSPGIDIVKKNPCSFSKVLIGKPTQALGMINALSYVM